MRPRDEWLSKCLCESVGRELLSVCSRGVGRERPGGTAVSRPALDRARVFRCVCPSLSPNVSVCVRDSVFECASAVNVCLYLSVFVLECTCVSVVYLSVLEHLPLLSVAVFKCLCP